MFQYRIAQISLTKVINNTAIFSRQEALARQSIPITQLRNQGQPKTSCRRRFWAAAAQCNTNLRFPRQKPRFTIHILVLEARKVRQGLTIRQVRLPCSQRSNRVEQHVAFECTDICVDNKPDSMAVATAHMQRPYPPIYHTPQSASPASVSSPQTLDHGRPMYAHQQAPMAQQMYPGYSYNQAQMNPMHQSAYGQHPSHPQYPQQVPTQNMASYQSNTPQMTNSQPPIHSANVSSSPRLKQESTHQYQQQPQQRTPLMPQSHVTSAPSQGSAGLQQSQPPSATQNSNAAPGPIPATTPLVVRRDGNGVQWISFEYSRDRVKMEYTIRCDVESVNTDTLNQEFKSENCVYPRACVPKEQYKGNRLNYETDCNQVGWSLAELNPCLRSKRGLIQRAVDSWRNSNQDQRLRSRRVRRQAKLNTRTKIAGQPVNQPTGQAGGISTGLPSQNSGM